MKRIHKEDQNQHFVRIKKLDDEKRICFGEVYAPYVLDSHGDFMAPEDIEAMAHRFMQLNNIQRAIDTNHNNQSNGSWPIESFIARKGDPDYTPGAWVLGVKVPDDAVWNAIKRGDLNGYSFEALVYKVAVIVSVDATPDHVGKTEDNEGHSHFFYVKLNSDGKVESGMTSDDEGHSHVIKRGTATEKSQNHSHRIIITGE